MKRSSLFTRTGLLFLAVVIAAGVVAAAAPSRSAAAETAAPSLSQVYDSMKAELSGQKALENVGYVYRGWRTTGGPWFNQVETWLQGNLDGLGFTPGESSSTDSYWLQQDVQTGSIWAPQYLSMQIIGPDGDADPASPGAYHFDHPAVTTFDPTSKYYPSYMTQDWVMSHIGTPEEEALQDRCHLATNSGFTSPTDTDLATADAAAIVAQVVNVGTITRSGTTYSWSNNPTASLSGRILVSTSSMSSCIGLAKQVGAKAVMTPAALSNYSHPTIDGVEWYPNNVRYASASSPGSIVALNISFQDSRYLVALCASTTPTMKIAAIGGTTPYSASNTMHTLIAEIKGTSKADERVVQMAHIQEPGANDNATGVGLQLEMLRTYKHLIDLGVLPRPRRTMTFMWGNEMTMSALYKASHPTEYNKIVAAFSNDMVGEDPVSTGSTYRIDKIPDPSARYAYQTDVLAGTTAPAPTQFLRQPDSHTLWGAGSLSFYPYPGHFLTDLYFAAGKYVEAGLPAGDTFRVGWNPYEGGSDAQPFVWNYDTVAGARVYNPIPALATFHFTDYVYHSSMDTMNKVSVNELRDVGLTTDVFAYYRADADIKSAGEVVDIVKDAAQQRFTWEKDNALQHFFWALTHPYGTPAPSTDAALHETFAGTGYSGGRSIGETQILGEWSTWYKQAVSSARTIIAAADSTPEYDAREAAAIAAVDAEQKDAQANAAHLLATFHFSAASAEIADGATFSASPDVVLKLAAASFAPGGVTGMRFSADGVTWPADFSPFADSAVFTVPGGDGAKTVWVQFQDSEGNISDSTSASIGLDTTGPQCSVDGVPAGWANQPVQLTSSASDGGASGVSLIEHKVGSADWAKGGSVAVAAEGTTEVSFRATDAVGNVGPEEKVSVSVDYGTPTISADAPTGWRNQPVTVHFASGDALSGVATVEYAVDGGAWQTGESVVIAAPGSGANDGAHAITCRVTDRAGNAAAASCSVRIDTQGPTARLTNHSPQRVARGHSWTLRYFVRDAQSPTVVATLTIKNARGHTVSTRSLGSVITRASGAFALRAGMARGTYTCVLTAVDEAGNPQVKAGTIKLIVQ